MSKFTCSFCGVGSVEISDEAPFQLKCDRCEAKSSLCETREQAYLDWFECVNLGEKGADKEAAVLANKILQEITWEELTTKELHWLHLACTFNDANYSFDLIKSWVLDGSCFLWRISGLIAVLQVKEYPDGLSLSLQILSGNITVIGVEEIRAVLRAKASSWGCSWDSGSVEIQESLA